MKNFFLPGLLAFFLLSILLCIPAFAQKERKERGDQERVRTVTIPISIFTKKELKENQMEEFIQADRLIVQEDDEEQTILSIRSVNNSPLTLAVLIQDDLTSNINLQLKLIGDFIRNLPKGSRVMVAYLRSGSMQTRQKFTTDLDRAADSLRIVVGNSAVAPRNPYDGVIDALNRFDAQPAGRRAILLISDGLDASSGLDSISPLQSIDLDRAILRAQRRSVAVYSFYTTGSLTEKAHSFIVGQAQSALQRISDETGGRAFFQGLSSPVSFDPFFEDLGILLNRQFALTYLSTHFKKGFHKVKVTSTNPEIKIEHPKGYFYR